MASDRYEVRSKDGQLRGYVQKESPDSPSSPAAEKSMLRFAVIGAIGCGIPVYLTSFHWIYVPGQNLGVAIFFGLWGGLVAGGVGGLAVGAIVGGAVGAIIDNWKSVLIVAAVILGIILLLQLK